MFNLPRPCSSPSELVITVGDPSGCRLPSLISISRRNIPSTLCHWGIFLYRHWHTHLIRPRVSLCPLVISVALVIAVAIRISSHAVLLAVLTVVLSSCSSPFFVSPSKRGHPPTTVGSWVIPPLVHMGTVLSLSSITPLMSLVPLSSLLSADPCPGGVAITAPFCSRVVHGVLTNHFWCALFLLSSSAEIMCGQESLFSLWWSLVLPLVSLFGSHGHCQTLKTAVGFSLAPPQWRNPIFGGCMYIPLVPTFLVISLIGWTPDKIVVGPLHHMVEISISSLTRRNE